MRFVCLCLLCSLALPLEAPHPDVPGRRGPLDLERFPRSWIVRFVLPCRIGR